MTTRRTEQDVRYNEPYRRTESAPPETAARTRPEPAPPESAMRTWTEMGPPEAGRRMPAEPAPAETTGRMSYADRISGGPVWSGFIIGFATWIVLEVFLVAVGLTGIRAGEGTTVEPSEWWWSLAAGLIALFVGGLVAGIASRWHTAAAGALQGLTVWALLFVGLLVLGAVGVGLGFGAFSDVVSVNAGLDGAEVPGTAIDTAQDAAGVAVLLLLATAAAAVVGGVIGARFASRRPRTSDLPATR